MFLAIIYYIIFLWTNNVVLITLPPISLSDHHRLCTFPIHWSPPPFFDLLPIFNFSDHIVWLSPISFPCSSVPLSVQLCDLFSDYLWSFYFHWAYFCSTLIIFLTAAFWSLVIYHLLFLVIVVSSPSIFPFIRSLAMITICLLPIILPRWPVICWSAPIGTISVHFLWLSLINWSLTTFLIAINSRQFEHLLPSDHRCLLAIRSASIWSSPFSRS